jgi:hypothetical protein
VGLLREIIWFKEGELGSVGRKLKSPKPRYETHREAAVLFALAAGTAFAFHYSLLGDVLYLYVVKLAVQALNAEGFFDSEGGPPPHP